MDVIYGSSQSETPPGLGGELVTDYRAQFREWDTAKSFLMRGERGNFGEKKDVDRGIPRFFKRRTHLSALMRGKGFYPDLVRKCAPPL